MESGETISFDPTTVQMTPALLGLATKKKAVNEPVQARGVVTVPLVDVE